MTKTLVANDDFDFEAEMVKWRKQVEHELRIALHNVIVKAGWMGSRR